MFKQTNVDEATLHQITLYYTSFSKKVPSSAVIFFAQKEATTITIYTNHTVTFQGSHAESEAARFFSQISTQKKQIQLFKNAHYPVIGSDESGAGDVFGPLVISAVFIENQKQYEQLKTLNITDSKKLSDAQNTALAVHIRHICNSHTVIFHNPRYNELIQRGINLNALKTAGHLQTTTTLFQKADTPASRITVDQFTPEMTFWKYVTQDLKKAIPTFKKTYYFQTKAENDFLEVAAASILARATYLQELDLLSKQIGEPLQKGAGILVDEQITRLKQHHTSFDAFAKTHFANIKKQMQ